MSLDTMKLLSAEEIDGITTLKHIIEKTASMFSVIDFLKKLSYCSIEEDIFKKLYPSKSINGMIKELESYQTALDAVPEDYN